MLWTESRNVLTEEEFCRTLRISRTSLWRYIKRRVEQNKPCGAIPKIGKPELDNDCVWREAAVALCREHITYGYRRVWILLSRAGHIVGKHKLRKWMRECELAQSVPIKDTGRTPGERPPDVERPNQGWQIDSTKIHTKQDGWAWQTSVLDLYDRRIVGYVVRKTCPDLSGPVERRTPNRSRFIGRR